MKENKWIRKKYSFNPPKCQEMGKIKKKENAGEIRITKDGQNESQNNK